MKDTFWAKIKLHTFAQYTMKIQFFVFVFFLIFTVSHASVLSDFNLRQFENLTPLSSVLHIVGDIKTGPPATWEIKLFNFILQNRNFLKVLHHIPMNHNITSNAYYRSCLRNWYIFSKYFGHSVSHVSIIFQHNLETDFDKKKLITTRSQLSKCGENPSYIFVVASVINSKIFHISPNAASTSRLLIIHGNQHSAELFQIFLVCIPCRMHSLIPIKPQIVKTHTFLDDSWKISNYDLKGLIVSSSETSDFDLQKHTCSAVQRDGRKFKGYVICSQLTIGGKLNFTDIKVVGALKSAHHNSEDFGFKIYYRILATESFIKFGVLYPVSA